MHRSRFLYHQTFVVEVREILATNNFFEKQSTSSAFHRMAMLTRIVDPLRLPPVTKNDMEDLILSFNNILDPDHEVYAGRLFTSTVLSLPPGESRQASVKALLDNGRIRRLLQVTTQRDLHNAQRRYDPHIMGSIRVLMFYSHTNPHYINLLKETRELLTEYSRNHVLLVLNRFLFLVAVQVVIYMFCRSLHK